eukprot:scaffold43208_cov74-Phaeocystis_antarctica.AAC.4
MCAGADGRRCARPQASSCRQPSFALRTTTGCYCHRLSPSTTAPRISRAPQSSLAWPSSANSRRVATSWRHAMTRDLRSHSTGS